MLDACMCDSVRVTGSFHPWSKEENDKVAATDTYELSQDNKTQTKSGNRGPCLYLHTQKENVMENPRGLH